MRITLGPKRLLPTTVALYAIASLPLQAQFIIKLNQQTIAEFDKYAATVEASLNTRWQGKESFLSIDEDAAAKAQVLAGKLFIKQMSNGQPVEIKDGLIHDWLGAIYIPNTKMERVLDILQDFDNHKHIYPEIADSKLIRRSGNDITGFWRLQQKGLVPVILDVEQDAHYQQLSPGKWKCEAHARNITEIDTRLFTRGRRFPRGEGHGYLWRLYGYWSLEEYRGGVLGECRTLSLSRDIPASLAWAVAPYVQKMPENSLTSTLTHTRAAATE